MGAGWDLSKFEFHMEIRISYGSLFVRQTLVLLDAWCGFHKNTERRFPLICNILIIFNIKSFGLYNETFCEDSKETHVQYVRVTHHLQGQSIMELFNETTLYNLLSRSITINAILK